MHEKIAVFDTSDAIANHIIRYIRRHFDHSVANTLYSLALSGGSTPQSVYAALAAETGGVMRDSALILQADERMVPYDSADSNMRMIDETLVTPARIPAEHIIHVNTALPHIDAAVLYAEAIDSSNYITTGENGIVQLDCIILGMGSDGHTASLFTESDCELTGSAVATVPEKLPHLRVSLSYATIINASKIFFIVTGNAKARRLANLASGDRTFPAAMVLRNGDNAEVLADTEAASLL
ncbi:MAG: 6-phosphogluconolactonase [Spirochaetota bacterium]